MMVQYNKIKEKYTNHILLFRLGDFFEIFNDDAIFCSQNLGLLLTKRQTTPMCGIPQHNIQIYIKKLLDLNQRVALCDQTETPEEAKDSGRKIVNRDVVRVFTKGTYVDMESDESNFLLSINTNHDSIGQKYYEMAYCDVSTGQSFTEDVEAHFLLSALYRIKPSEILLPLSQEKEISSFCNFVDYITLRNGNNPEEMLIEYVKENGLDINLTFNQRKNQNFAKLDRNTIKNLEILESINGDKKNSLFSILNKTQTSMGKRILKEMLLRPLNKKSQINARLDCVEFFRKILTYKKIQINSYDIQKLINHVSDFKDFLKLGNSISNSLDIIEKLGVIPLLLFNLHQNLKPINLHKRITDYIDEDGNCIESEKLKFLKNKLKELFESCELIIKNNKVNGKIKENNLIGLFIECNKNTLVPEDWILKQGLANTKRYTSSILIQKECEIKEIRNQIDNYEKDVLRLLKEEAERDKQEINNLSRIIGLIDYFHSCAEVSIENNYHRPAFDSEHVDIREGRHPCIEKNTNHFIKNNLKMIDKNIWIITGPNMGGKSTFLRQNAIIILMAQVGMFVPAKMNSKVFDGIFVRLGSSDNINFHESTFMLEMKECSEILSISTADSFICLDEIGRGTSIRDGISISMAILWYIHNYKKCCTLVSTHYNELSVCDQFFDSIINKRVKVSQEDSVILLYKVEDGISRDSFGIEVIKKIMPRLIVDKSQKIFNDINFKMESKSLKENIK